eukprot:5085577-Amphidinium_carterae.1
MPVTELCSCGNWISLPSGVLRPRHDDSNRKSCAKCLPPYRSKWAVIEATKIVLVALLLTQRIHSPRESKAQIVFHFPAQFSIGAVGGSKEFMGYPAATHTQRLWHRQRKGKSIAILRIKRDGRIFSPQ